MARFVLAVTLPPFGILSSLWYTLSLLQYCNADPKTSYMLDKALDVIEPSVHAVIKPRHRRQPAEIIHNETIIDNHNYYISKYFSSGGAFWVNLDNPAIAEDVQVPEILATAERQGKLLQLGFPFLYYGHEINSVVLTTGGFIYTGSYIHRHLAATQYIAPLMGNFIPSSSDTAGVRFYDNGTALTVEWREQNLKDNIQAGLFTFQATLFQDGRIVFAYKQIAIPVSRIPEDGHPVEVGIADAYYIDTLIAPFSKRREIYQYHSVNLDVNKVGNGTAILILPLPTCVQMKSCKTCLSTHISFNCTWCESFRSSPRRSPTGRCSDGLDQGRQAWLNSHCNEPENFVDTMSECPGYTSTTTEVPPPSKAPPIATVQANTVISTAAPKQTTVDYCKNVKCLNDGVCEEGFCNCPPKFDGSRCQKYVTGHCENIDCKNGGTCREGIPTRICDCKPGFSGTYCDVVNEPTSTTRRGLTAGGVACIVLISILIGGLFMWAVYAYRHPTSPSGLFILEAKHKLKGRGRGSNGVKYKYHQQVDTNQVDIQL